MKSAWLTGILVCAVFLASVALDIELPGVYMDAVNPDYLAVAILNPGHDIERWVLPGNYILNRFPVLTSLYHGSGQMWLALPFFALLGTTVESLRIVHGLFACGILIAATLWLRRAGVGNVAIAVVGIAIALDPSFVFAFRTQSYITTSPLAWLLLAWVALERTRHDVDPPRWFLLAGVAYGCSLFGYFIYVFYLPALLVAVATWPASDDAHVAPRTRLARFALGTALGAILYPIGYLLILRQYGSIAGLLDYLRQTQQQLGVMESPLDLYGRIAYAWDMVKAVTYNWWQFRMMTGDYGSVPGAEVKTALLVFAPLALWLVAEIRGLASAPLRLTVGAAATFFACSLVFGSRLGGHHYVGMLVLGYLAVALGMQALLREREGRHRRTGRAAALAIVPMLALVPLSLAGQIETRAKLRDTGGAGLLSTTIDRFALDARSRHARDYYIFPDWGLAMPFAFLTGGGVDYGSRLDLRQARALLCRGRDVHLALVDGDRANRIADWAGQLAWADPSVAAYRQRDGKIVFEVATWRAATAGSADPRCGSK